MNFKLKTNLIPKGDQPKVIRELTEWVLRENRFQTLMGVTASGKTYMLANVIQNIQKPTLVVSHNKVLASQLYQEFKDFFPDNAVHYFVSYYDYYQPEAYLPTTDTYIEKDAKINDEIDRLRHAATQAILTRNDVIIVASVSCIYNIGSPEEYQKIAIGLRQRQLIKIKDLARALVKLQYERSDFAPLPGTFRVRGEVVDIFLPAGNEMISIEFFGDEIESLYQRKFRHISELFDSSIQNTRYKILNTKLFPAKHYVTPQGKLELALENIRLEMEERHQYFLKQEKFVEAQRIKERTLFDLEMLKETGYCTGIENYSRQLDFREPGSAPSSLIDYFASNYLLIVDESHITIPQFRGMYEGDHARKQMLVNYGFRLPSALDNRPLKFSEFENKIHQGIFSSATPGPYELEKSKEYVSEAIVRPTGLLDPKVEVRPTANQISDLIQEVKTRAQRGERSLILTITKRMAEDLADFLEEKGLKVTWIHSEIKTLERPEILYNLRKGNIDALVGINLLREGLDLPEVSLVIILDADKEGYLRNYTSFIQLFGRAARHINGRVLLYADTMTGSIKRALFETERRRRIQQAYNTRHHITPEGIIKEVKRIELVGRREEKEMLPTFKGKPIIELEKEMWEASKNLQFEKAATLRDMIRKLSLEAKRRE
ncbi:MAG: excinuclease ABC subunit UvrB [Candidatus Portnoybacteria bacterium]|nr:excinuclease ABC subunit UvrB [Candidatus Portnoybacteria bacterium]